MNAPLNRKENIIFAKNLLKVIRSWCENNDLVFNVYDNNFIKPTKNVNKEYETKILNKQIKGDDKDNLSNIESDVSGLIKLTSINILCIDEMKLGFSYPNAQFHIDRYQFPPFRKDRNKYGGRKMLHTRDGIIAKCLENLKGKHSEAICLELTVSTRKWSLTFAFRQPSNDNKAIFFKIKNLYDYFVVMGDLNIDTSDKTKDTSC